jgi:hypothetical protein
LPELHDPDEAKLDTYSSDLQRLRVGRFKVRTEIKHACDCGKTFVIDSARPLVAVTILQVSIKNHSKDCADAQN